MLLKYIGLLYLFISKVSSRIGVSLKDGKGMPLIPYPTPFSPSPLSLYPLSFLNSLLVLLSHPSFPVFPLSHPYCLFLFSLPSPLSLLRVPFPSHSLVTPSSLLFPLPSYFSFSQSLSPNSLPVPISLVLTLFSPLTETIPPTFLLIPSSLLSCPLSPILFLFFQISSILIACSHFIFLPLLSPFTKTLSPSILSLLSPTSFPPLSHHLSFLFSFLSFVYRREKCPL